MKRKFLFFLCFISYSALAQIDDFRFRHHCPQESTTTNIKQIPEFLTANNIVLKNSPKSSYVAQFLNEYQKFPEELREKMVEAGGVIHLIQGTGVTADPTWSLANGTNSFDGRDWTNIVGTGGTPSNKYKSVPTRIVVNHLYDNHGSINLFLHEQAHALDGLPANFFSKSMGWYELNRKPEVQSFLSIICGSYCTQNIREGFAEMFAYYHSCPATKADVHNFLPEVARYFDELINFL